MCVEGNLCPKADSPTLLPTVSGQELLKGSLGGMWAEGRSYIQTQHGQLQ